MESTYKASQIFSPYRALGYVSNGVPFALQALGNEHFVATVVGKSFHLYNCSKLDLLFVGTPQSDAINCIVTYGQLVITAAGDVVKSWRRGKQITDYKGHESEVHILLPFGEHLLSINKKNCLKIWEVKSADLYLELDFDPSTFYITAILHPSTYLNKILLASQQGEMQLWNIKTSKLIYTFSKWSEPITVLEQTTIVNVIAIGFQSGKIILHNIKLDESLINFFQDWGPVTAISFRTDGQPFMATSSTIGHIAIWNLDERCLSSVLRNAHDGSVTSIQFLHSQPLLLSSGPDNSLKMWIFDQADGNGRLLKSRSGHGAPLSKIRFYGSKGYNIISAGQDCSLRITSTIRDSQNCELSQGSFAKKAKKYGVKVDQLKLPAVIDFDAEETRQRDWDNIVTCHQASPEVRTWNFKSKCIGKHVLKPKQDIKEKYVAQCVTISSCGNFCVVGLSSGHVNIYNIQSGMNRGSLGKAHEGCIRGVLMDGLNQQVISASSDETIKFWQFKSKKLVSTLHVDVPVSQTILHRDSSLMAAALDDFIIKVIDVDIKRVVRIFSGHRNRINDMTFSPDARWLVTCSLDSSIRTWDLPSGRLLDCFLVESPATSVTFSPVGDFLATSHVDDVGIYLWVNKLLYTTVSLVPLAANFQPLLIDFPSSKVIDDDNSMEVNPSNCEEENSVYEEAGEEEFKSPDQISNELITISLYPESRWRSLVNLDVIKERNKPKEPPKVPKAAPFFLPTVPGVNLTFDITEEESNKTNKTKSKISAPESLRDCSEFQKLLLGCIPTGEYSVLSSKLRNMGPSAIDAELRGLAPDAGGDIVLMKSMMVYMIEQLKSRKDFELVQGYMALFLKLHGDIISNEPSLLEQAGILQKQLDECSTSLQDLLNQNLCLVTYLKSATI